MSPVQLLFNDIQFNNSMTIDQQPIIQSTAFTHNFRKNDTEVKTLELNGFEATLIYFNRTGTRQLMWQSPAMYYLISGPLSEDEIIRIGRSIR
jgi:hypothetical protein